MIINRLYSQLSISYHLETYTAAFKGVFKRFISSTYNILLGEERYEGDRFLRGAKEYIIKMANNLLTYLNSFIV